CRTPAWLCPACRRVHMPLPAADELRRFRDTTRPLLKPVRSLPRIVELAADDRRKLCSSATRADRFATPTGFPHSIVQAGPAAITRTHTTDAPTRSWGRVSTLKPIAYVPKSSLAASSQENK